MTTMQVKENGICRIFFSSPFRGLEVEREELTRRYWPQIKSFCNARGLQFVPVDMRWGITSELSDSAQTIKICLKEIDRSDMFVGFFGQVRSEDDDFREDKLLKQRLDPNALLQNMIVSKMMHIALTLIYFGLVRME